MRAVFRLLWVVATAIMACGILFAQAPTTDHTPDLFIWVAVVHIRNPEGPALPVLVPRAMTYSEAREYGTWMLAKHLGRDTRPHR